MNAREGSGTNEYAAASSSTSRDRIYDPERNDVCMDTTFFLSFFFFFFCLLA